MSLHLLFADGSNPYIKYNLTPAEFAREVLEWSKEFDLEFIKATDTIIHMRATGKQNAGNTMQ